MRIMLQYLPWLLVSILYFPVLKDLYMSRWQAVDYTHAYFILPISIWLVWRKKAALKQAFREVKGRDSIWHGVLFISGVFLFIFGWRWGYLAVASFSLPVVIYGLIGFLYGPAVVSRIRFPVLYLFALVPPPLGIVDNMTLPMRKLISVATALFLRLSGYPVVRDGLLLNVGGHEVFLGQPCSGFRSLVTMLALALVYVYLSSGRLAKKAVLLAGVIPLALFGNFVRVTILSLIAYHAGEEAAQGFFHNFSGLVIFVVMILGLLGLEVFIDRVEKKQTSTKSG